MRDRMSEHRWTTYLVCAPRCRLVHQRAAGQRARWRSSVVGVEECGGGAAVWTVRIWTWFRVIFGSPMPGCNRRFPMTVDSGLA